MPLMEYFAFLGHPYTSLLLSNQAISQADIMYFVCSIAISSILGIKCKVRYLHYPSLHSALKSPEAKQYMIVKNIFPDFLLIKCP